MFKGNKDNRKNEDMDFMQILKEHLESTRIEIVVGGLQSDFELSIKNVQGNKKGLSSPKIKLEGSLSGMLVAMAILYKELKKKIPMYDGILNDIIDTLDSITEKYEVVEKEIK